MDGQLGKLVAVVVLLYAVAVSFGIGADAHDWALGANFFVGVVGATGAALVALAF